MNERQQFGRAAEDAAARYLQHRGWRLIDRNVRIGRGELDMIVRRGSVLAFVEVKARGDFVKAADALGDRQFGRVSRAASLFIAHHPRYAACSVRFDAVLVGGVWPRHLPDVWQAPE